MNVYIGTQKFTQIYNQKLKPFEWKCKTNLTKHLKLSLHDQFNNNL
jgi:hypothetical protein